jgi:hypothetical protein
LRNIEDAFFYNAMEEGFVETGEEMAEFSLGRVTDMDSWTGQDLLIAYSTIQNLTIRVLRPTEPGTSLARATPKFKCSSAT